MRSPRRRPNISTEADDAKCMYTKKEKKLSIENDVSMSSTLYYKVPLDTTMPARVVSHRRPGLGHIHAHITIEQQILSRLRKLSTSGSFLRSFVRLLRIVCGMQVAEPITIECRRTNEFFGDDILDLAATLSVTLTMLKINL